MSTIVVEGVGAVSPAGWGVNALLESCAQNAGRPLEEMACPGYSRPLHVRRVPSIKTRPTVSHPRLRRTSPIAQFAVSSAMEALGNDAAVFSAGAARLGIIYCSMSGCVNFSRRFYDETLKDASTASPLVFPETVFNAPASHLGALLGSRCINYTLVGDPGTFLQGLALAADWLSQDRVEGCLVVGAEELDWLISEAFDLFHPDGVVSEGAGAVYLKRQTSAQPGKTQLCAVTDSYLFSSRKDRVVAARRAREELGTGEGKELLCDSRQSLQRVDRDEAAAWTGWEGACWSPKTLLGEGFMASAAWQCAAGAAAVTGGLYDAANVSVVGYNQQAIAARFGRS